MIDKFHEWREKTLNEFAKDALKATVFASFSYQQLEIALQKCFSEEEAKDLARLLITGLEGDLTVDANLKMWEVAQGELTLEDFLEKHGHRSVSEFELAQPRWREDPSYVQQIIDIVPHQSRCQSDEASSSPEDKSGKSKKEIGTVTGKQSRRVSETDQ